AVGPSTGGGRFRSVAAGRRLFGPPVIGEQPASAKQGVPVSDDTSVPRPDDVVRVHADGREYLLVGTAHVSQESADAVARVIEAERPDCVAVELDTRRYDPLPHPHPLR